MVIASIEALSAHNIHKKLKKGVVKALTTTVAVRTYFDDNKFKSCKSLIGTRTDRLS